MIGLLLSLASALIWGAASVAGGLGSRVVGPQRLIVFGFMTGMLLAVPLAILSGAPGTIDLATVLWIVVIMASMLGGLVLVYMAMRRGSISVVAPISALYGGIGALISIATGQDVGGLVIASLALAVFGGALAASGKTADPGVAYSNQRLAAVLAAGTAVLWGVQLWASGQIQAELGPSWLVLIARGLGMIVLIAIMAPRGELRIPRRILPYAALAGCGEVVGFTLYLLASGYGVAQAAVISGQYGTVAAVIGIVILKERLRGIQYVGLACIVVAVVGLSLA